jgi:predicted O-methyltransferase YrrM
VADRIDLTIGPAIETPRALPADLPVDIAFIDADNPAYQEEHHQAMRRLNNVIAADERVEAVMLTLRDGLTLARKR